MAATPIGDPRKRRMETTPIGRQEQSTSPVPPVSKQDISSNLASLRDILLFWQSARPDLDDYRVTTLTDILITTAVEHEEAFDPELPLAAIRILFECVWRLARQTKEQHLGKLLFGTLEGEAEVRAREFLKLIMKMDRRAADTAQLRLDTMFPEDA